MRQIVLLVLMALLTFSPSVLAQANPRGQANAGDVEIEYGCPSAGGRDVLSMMRPGSYWRLGADTETTLRTKSDLRFGDKAVSQGSYALAAHLTEQGQWQLVVAKSLGSGYQPEGIVAVVPLELKKNQPTVDRMTIDLSRKGNSYQFTLSWGTNRLITEFSQ